MKLSGDMFFSHLHLSDLNPNVVQKWVSSPGSFGLFGFFFNEW